MGDPRRNAGPRRDGGRDVARCRCASACCTLQADRVQPSDDMLAVMPSAVVMAVPAARMHRAVVAEIPAHLRRSCYPAPDDGRHRSTIVCGAPAAMPAMVVRHIRRSEPAQARPRARYTPDGWGAGRKIRVPQCRHGSRAASHPPAACIHRPRHL